MSIFGKITPKPKVQEIILEREYQFMYENFVISSQHTIYILLRKSNEIIDCLCFNFNIYKYGYPNDEAMHPLTRYGLGVYGFFEVRNSSWIEEIKRNNQSHSSHSDSHYADKKHYVLRFKDITFEVISGDYELRQISREKLFSIIDEQLEYLRN